MDLLNLRSIHKNDEFMAKELRIPVKLNEMVEASAVLDSGSVENVMSVKFYTKHVEQLGNLDNEDSSFRAANGSIMEPLGSITVSLKFSNGLCLEKFKIFVLEITDNLLLGLNFLLVLKQHFGGYHFCQYRGMRIPILKVTDDQGTVKGRVKLIEGSHHHNHEILVSKIQKKELNQENSKLDLIYHGPKIKLTKGQRIPIDLEIGNLKNWKNKNPIGVLGCHEDFGYFAGASELERLYDTRKYDGVMKTHFTSTSLKPITLFPKTKIGVLENADSKKWPRRLVEDAKLMKEFSEIEDSLPSKVSFSSPGYDSLEFQISEPTIRNSTELIGSDSGLNENEQTHKKIVSLGHRSKIDNIFRKFEINHNFNRKNRDRFKAIVSKSTRLFNVDENDFPYLKSPDGKTLYGSLFLPPGETLTCNSYKKKPLSMEAALQKTINEYMKRKIFKTSPSQTFTGNIYNIPKGVKDGKMQFRTILSMIELSRKSCNQAFSLPTPVELYHEFGKAKCFSIIDMKDSFYSLKLQPQECILTSFLVKSQAYCLDRIPQGHKNSSFNLVKALDAILNPIREKCRVYNYIDDMICISDSQEQMIEQLAILLPHLEKCGMTLNPSKCLFGMTSVTWAGYSINAGHISLPTSYIDKLNLIEREIPTTIRQVQKILGYCNYLRGYVPHYSSLTAPLNRLVSSENKEKITWGDEQKLALSEVIRILKEKHKLYQWHNDHKTHELVILSDASLYGIAGAVFERNIETGKEFLLKLVSRSLRKSEINYSVYRKEALALAYTVEQCRFFLEGNAQMKQIYVDSKSLYTLARSTKSNSTFGVFVESIKELL